MFGVSWTSLAPRSVDAVSEKRGPQSGWDDGRLRVAGIDSHAHDILFAPRYELFASLFNSPEFEHKIHAALRQVRQAHTDDDLIEREELSHVVARTPRGHETEIAAELVEDFGDELTQKELATAALPPKVIDVVNVSNEVRLLERD